MTAKEITFVIIAVLVCAALFFGGRSSGFAAGREQSELDLLKAHVGTLETRVQTLESWKERWGKGHPGAPGASQ